MYGIFSLHFDPGFSLLNVGVSKFAEDSDDSFVMLVGYNNTTTTVSIEDTPVEYADGLAVFAVVIGQGYNPETLNPFAFDIVCVTCVTKFCNRFRDIDDNYCYVWVCLAVVDG